MPHTIQTPVLIVGAGPSGLMMACQLARHNIRFRIIDQKKEPSSYSGALFIQARSLEIFHQMGIVAKVMGQGSVANTINLVFNGRKPISLQIKNLGSGITRFPHLLMLEQSKTEQILINDMEGYAATVERSTSLLHFTQNSEGVTSVLKRPDGSEEIVHTKYLIAADGGHSLVRQQLHIPFLGKTHRLSLFVMDTKAEVKMPPNEICFTFSNHASSGIFPLSDGLWRIDGTIPKELKGSVAFHDIAEKFAQRIRMNITLHEPRWFSVFHSHQRYAGSFRKNRCFLIGDAAHVLSPVGAQGMNTGLQDAHNLAWKLALVIDGKANDPILNSYHAERQQLAKELVRSTDKLFYLVSSQNLLSKIFRLGVAPLLLKVLFPIVERYKPLGLFLFEGVSEIGIHYRKSALSKHSSLGTFPRHAPKPGDRLPFIMLIENEKEISIQDKVNDTSFHLLVFGKQTSGSMVVADQYKGLLSLDILPFNPQTAALYKRFGITHEGFYLIRPDMHIAYRSNNASFEDFERFFKELLAFG
jgi:2-polyprenyl-6-methoxyphenol hydroxylase-like FAD-dependent oxidoreductase